MTFQEININELFLVDLIVFTLGVFVLVGWFTTALLGLEGAKARHVMIAGLVAVTLTGSFGFAFNHLDTVKEQSKTIVESNVKKKYNVDEIRFEAVSVKTKAEKTSEQEVQVVVDGKSYIFHMTQDPETWEPTLTDPPALGGSAKTAELSAEDLLK